MIGNLNINYLFSKFGKLKLFIQGSIDILVITETRRKFSPWLGYNKWVFKTLRLDKNLSRGDVIMYYG